MKVVAGNRIDHKTWLYYLVSAIMLPCLVYMAFPYFRYYIDPDATSYLTIVRQYLQGNYEAAINAFWSPMGCWLTVLLVKATGFSLFPAAIVVNTVAGTGTVVLSQVLFFRFRKTHFERLCFTVVAVLFWSYAVYKQSFTDLWQYLFLLAGLLLLLLANFHRKPWLWILCGLIAALAYYGKAYSFFFFPLMVLAGLFIRLKSGQIFTLKRWLGITAVVVLTMVVVASPWIYLLHGKYGIWTTSTAGTLNLSWWLTGHPEFRSDIKILLPPPHPGSVFSFEDPYLIQGHFEHFWDSPRLFLKQLVRVGYNAIAWVQSCGILSPFYFITWLITLLLLSGRKRFSFFQDPGLKIVAITFLLYPAAFWLMTFDNGRYLWITIPLSMILGLSITDKFGRTFGDWPRKIFVVLFFSSYLAGIVPDLRIMVHTGEEEFRIAHAIKNAGIKGSFTTNQAIAGPVGQYMLRIAYFSQCPLYCYGENKWTEEDILMDAKRYGVKYYFYFYNGANRDYHLRDAAGVPLKELTKGTIAGLKIFELQ